MPRWQYKIVRARVKFFTGRIDTDALELALNQMADDGWRLVTFVTAEWYGYTDDLVAVIER